MVELLLMINLHIVGDFYLQTNKVARCKNAKKSAMCENCNRCREKAWINWKYLLIHTLLYILPFIVLYYWMTIGQATVAVCLLFVSHLFVDSLSCYFNKRMKQTVIFILDQAVHIGILWLIYISLPFYCNLEIYYVGLKAALVGLTLFMPCSIMISKLFEDVYPDMECGEIYDIGSLIGVMERILTIIFACYGNFSAIAIIITVKTWARTNDLKSDEFRNKYLLGTLTSLVLALLVYVVYNVHFPRGD